MIQKVGTKNPKRLFAEREREAGSKKVILEFFRNIFRKHFDSFS